MVDVLNPDQRRYNMSRIKGGETKPELLIRRALHAEGFRYRLHQRTLPGRPDIVLPRYQVAIFVHGCFWHAHDCHLVKKPATRAAFWEDKLRCNAGRDQAAITALQYKGWRVVIIWECALRGTTKQPFNQLIQRVARYIKGQATEVLSLTGAR